MLDRTAPHGLPIPLEAFYFRERSELAAACARCHAEPHRANRFARHTTVRSSDTADRHRKRCARHTERTCSHLFNSLLTDGTMSIERALADPKVTNLGRVRIRNEPTLEPVRAAGDVGQHLCDPPAGTGFRCGHAHPGGLRACGKTNGKSEKRSVGWCSGWHGGQCTRPRAHWGGRTTSLR